MATSVLADNDEVSATDVLSFVKAANDVRKAAHVTLNEVVAEAITRGATWTQIGEALGIQRTAAQKHFGKGLSDRRKAELKHEATGCMMLYAFWSGQIPAEKLGFDSSDWKAATIETAVDYAVRTIAKAIGLHLAHISEAGKTPTLEELYRIYDLTRTSLHILMVPEALEAVANYSDMHGSWTDLNAPTYFVQAACHLAFTFNHFSKLWVELGDDDDEAAKRRMAYIHRNLLDVMHNLSRPECLRVLANMEETILESGNTLYLDMRKEEGSGFSQMEIFEAVWRKDKAKIAEILGVAEVTDVPSLDDLLNL